RVERHVADVEPGDLAREGRLADRGGDVCDRKVVPRLLGQAVERRRQQPVHRRRAVRSRTRGIVVRDDDLRGVVLRRGGRRTDGTEEPRVDLHAALAVCGDRARLAGDLTLGADARLRALRVRGAGRVAAAAPLLDDAGLTHRAVGYGETRFAARLAS